MKDDAMDFPRMEEWTEEALPPRDGVPKQVHVFDKEAVQAVQTAFAAKRPLLVRGEPGMGKSQLARAVAQKLQRPYVPFVVDSRTESRDLLWSYDAVRRLADAQLLSTGSRFLPQLAADEKDAVNRQAAQDIRKWLDQQLDVSKYVSPGPLWWAFSWGDAARQAENAKTKGRDPQPGSKVKNGCVVLIDEIDKAETDVPNGLLEALGDGQFLPFGNSDPVSIVGQPPLVFITSNEERTLPNAFVRRCVVLNLKLPEDSKDLTNHLVSRGQAHFNELRSDDGRALLKTVAEQLVKDRQTAQRNHTKPYPGQAEYLDLVRALMEIGKTNDERKSLVSELSRFVFIKYPDDVA